MLVSFQLGYEFIFLSANWDAVQPSRHVYDDNILLGNMIGVKLQICLGNHMIFLVQFGINKHK